MFVDKNPITAEPNKFIFSKPFCFTFFLCVVVFGLEIKGLLGHSTTISTLSPLSIDGSTFQSNTTWGLTHPHGRLNG